MTVHCKIFNEQRINWDAVFENFQILKFSNSQINKNQIFLNPPSDRESRNEDGKNLNTWQTLKH